MTGDGVCDSECDAVHDGVCDGVCDVDVVHDGVSVMQCLTCNGEGWG